MEELKTFRNSTQKGAIASGMLAAIGIAATVLLSFAGYMVTATSSLDQEATNVRERVTVVETEVENMEGDIDEIKADVKALLRAFNVPSPTK